MLPQITFNVWLYFNLILPLPSSGVPLISITEIVALAGEDVILPCHLKPAVSASSETVVWTKPDLIPKYIHVHHQGQIMCPRQNPSYINRTNLFEQELKNGNLSLKLSSVKIQDTGKYFCQLQSMQEEASIQLTVALSELICSRQPIVALAGDDVILPCHLEPAVSAGSETVVWTKPDLDPKYIHFHHDGRLMYQFQNPSYYYRTRLFVDELTKGNVSVKIFSVKISDSGKYFCFLQSLQMEASIQLTVALSELICSRQPIVALAGDDVILPCHLEPAVSAGSETVVWTKPNLDPKYIHFHHDGRLMYQFQNPSYNYRTRLFVDELTKGNVSVKIVSVKISDSGKYFCFLQSLQKEASIQLTVGVVSTLIIHVVSNNSSSVVLQCESEGWYPEPEVFWLDGEGNLLSAGPTETVRGPDDLYTVSSRVTVEKRHSNNFTCRVQQKDINQTRDTHIQVTGIKRNSN
ncbi:butyrophilin-like protein 2 isoform X2 [Micropterus salmoides]|uniref:butyrophilin-like protein 2 isoform X2 n=1 Tax=Micropterus salmoides TaxID=27706 RepID=UPI0018EB7533|nr:butyrophilin-like protein 2 isoform X2 [Micropterus salmoides]